MVPADRPSPLAAFGAETANLSAAWPPSPRRSSTTRRAAEPAGRVVRTRHGDAMLLTDFMVTRVVELAVHGLDLADALGRPPWTHDSAVEVVIRLFVPSTFDASGWDRMTLLRVATGRGGSEDRAGIRRLALG
jgi:hypothetical protein